MEPMSTRKDIKSIKIILYDCEDVSCDMVKRFMNLTNVELRAYDDELHLEELKKHYQAHCSSREIVILKKHRGSFFHKCPGSKNVICCNYYIINTGFNCLYNCTYCYLNYYLNSFGIVQFTNMEDMYARYRMAIHDELKHKKLVRIGSGEYTDSLMMDEVTGIGEKLIEISMEVPNVILELKTKSDNIDHLLNIPNKGNSVLAWTISTERNILLYEKNTSSLQSRIAAARKAADAGYHVAFHFDPIIVYDGFLNDYRRIIGLIFKTVNPDKILWISMGGFRYSYDFKDIINKTEPDELLTAEEMFPGVDGKYRYLKKKRIQLYGEMSDMIYACSRRPFVYLCMETGDVWHSVFRKNYKTSDDLENDFVNHLSNII